MPKYYFNVVNEDGTKVEDRDGVELSDYAAAAERAKELARAIVEAELTRSQAKKPH